jgi:tRNA(Arg) A34 adenosine deaminase TadA
MRDEAVLKILDKVAESIEPVANARIASAIVYRNDIVAIGTNKKKSHPFQRRFAKHDLAIYLHAEIDAIKNAMRHLSLGELAKSKMYISRIRYADSEPNPTPDKLIRGLARPCEGCMRAIATFDIKHVCFTSDKGPEWL